MDAVGAVTQNRLQQIPNFNSRRGILGATGLEANQVWMCEPNLGGILNKEGRQRSFAHQVLPLELVLYPFQKSASTINC
jgi:hypothetical protein